VRGDAEPFGICLGGRDRRSSGAGEPVGGVAGIAFDEVKESMDPGSVTGVDILSDFVGGVPVAAAGMPEGGEEGREPGRGRGIPVCAGEEIRAGHG
jgi:hypothetical protein